MDKIGERIRKRREYLELPMNTLAKGIGITPSMLSQIENGKAYPSLHTIKHIADYLNTSVGSLIGENDTFSSNPVITWDEKKFVKRNENGASLYLLSQYSPLQVMEIYLLELENGGNSNDLLDNRRYGQEYCFVLNGKVTLNLTEKTYDLNMQDSIYYYSHDLKYFQNIATGISQVFWIISPLKTY
jgi:XRE family transcriptional regulator, regulator of sulfur utilization